MGDGRAGMGTSYQGLLVVGDLDVVVGALADGGVTAYVAQAAPDRVAVIPKESLSRSYADVASIAVLLSGQHGLAVLVHEMYDSDLLSLWVYEHGVVTHEYVSDIAITGEVMETDEGFVQTIDGVTYAMDDPAAPSGPRGADPVKIAPFGVGVIDRDRLGRLLVNGDDYAFVEGWHRLIVEALNLDPEPLTVAYRWFERGDRELGAVHVTHADQ